MTKPDINMHLVHHMFPNCKSIIALNPTSIIVKTIGFYFIYSLFINNINAIAIAIGLLVGITLYDIFHYYCHHGPEINLKIINNLKRNHLKHHYSDSNRGFGVSTTLWDKIFGTEHIIN